MHIKNANLESVCVIKEFRSLLCLEYAGAAGDNGDVGSGIDFNSLADFKAVVHVLIKNTVKAAVDADIIGAEVVVCRVDCVCGFHSVCRNDNGKVRHCSCDCKVNNCVVG